MLHIEHIGIAVNNLDEANETYYKLLGKPHYKIEEVESQGVLTSFFQVGPNKIELLAPTNSDSPIARFLEKKGEGMHHIAFAVENIYSEMARLEAEGFTLLNKEPVLGADNKLICFVHPKGAHRVLIELCQDKPAMESAAAVSVSQADRDNWD